MTRSRAVVPGRLQAGARIAVDLASFEVVRAFRPQLLALLEGARPDFLICNEARAHPWLFSSRSPLQSSVCLLLPLTSSNQFDQDI